MRTYIGAPISAADVGVRPKAALAASSAASLHDDQCCIARYGERSCSDIRLSTVSVTTFRNHLACTMRSLCVLELSGPCEFQAAERTLAVEKHTPIQAREGRQPAKTCRQNAPVEARDRRAPVEACDKGARRCSARATGVRRATRSTSRCPRRSR